MSDPAVILSSVGFCARANLRLNSNYSGVCFPLLVVVVEHALAMIVGNIDTLQIVEHRCHSLLRGVLCIGTLVELEQMSKLVDDSILVVNGLIKAFDVAFLMVRQLVGVGMLRCEPVSPGSVKQWKVDGS